MSNLLRSIGEVFGMGDPKVDQDQLRYEQRLKMREREKSLDLEAQEQASRQRSARGGRRAALASQVRDSDRLG